VSFRFGEDGMPIESYREGYAEPKQFRDMNEAELNEERTRLSNIIEKPKRIEKLRNSLPVNIEKRDYLNKYNLDANSAQ